MDELGSDGGKERGRKNRRVEHMQPRQGGRFFRTKRQRKKTRKNWGRLREKKTKGGGIKI